MTGCTLICRRHKGRNRAARLAANTTFSVRASLIFLGVLSIVVAFASGASAQQANAKNALVLFSGIRTDNQFLDLIEPVIRARVPGPITFYDAYLIYNQEEEKGKSSWQSEAETLRSTYAGVKFDIVIAVSSQAIHFAVQYRDKLFPGVPIVITQVDRREIDGRIWPGVTGLTLSMGIGETIDLALRLQPDTKAVAVISMPDSPWLAITHSELLRRQNKVREIDFVEPPNRALLAVIVVQTLLILALLWQRARKRKAEAVLRESEKRFRVMADSTPSLIWMCDDKGKVTYLNEQRLLFTGSDPHAGYGDTWIGYIHPDDLDHVKNALSKALKDRQPFSKEYRLRRVDGMYRWMFDVAAPRINGDGAFAGFIGSAADITDQKLAREALETVSGQLIAAQEKERSRLARELHDDICQRLAMISFKIEKANKSWGRAPSSIPDQLEQIWQHCSKLAGDVQALSHELHPSILENLGLATAVKSFCREISEQNDAVVDVVTSDIPNSLPREVSLSLFRVVQEALHNAVKYSGQKHFEVRLLRKDGEIELEVSDEGVGFDAASIKGGAGLGLVSMAERIHQVNGTFNIESEPNGGTRIQARVPIATQPKDITAAVN
jgi:PAS domain S-box-containing protein